MFLRTVETPDNEKKPFFIYFFKSLCLWFILDLTKLPSNVHWLHMPGDWNRWAFGFPSHTELPFVGRRQNSINSVCPSGKFSYLSKICRENYLSLNFLCLFKDWLRKYTFFIVTLIKSSKKFTEIKTINIFKLVDNKNISSIFLVYVNWIITN